MRYLFYGMIVLTVLLVIVIIDQAVYWTSRIFASRHTAHVIHFSVSGALIVIIAVASLWGHYVTRYRLDVTHTDVASPRVPAPYDGFRIAQISDMHLDWFDDAEGHAFLSRVIETLANEKPDLIVFTGDLVTRLSAEAEPFCDELLHLANIPSGRGDGTMIPVYSILGNHDYADYTRLSPRERLADVNHLCEIQSKAGWHLLRNEGILLQADGSTSPDSCIALVGVDNIGEPPFSTYGDLPKALATLPIAAPFSILLSHNPTHWRSEVLPKSGIDLMLAGHTHAVQLKIGSWSPAVWKYPEWSGLYSETDGDHPQYLYVNTGLGGVGPRVRIGIAPEVSILTLRRTADEPRQ